MTIPQEGARNSTVQAMSQIDQELQGLALGFNALQSSSVGQTFGSCDRMPSSIVFTLEFHHHFPVLTKSEISS